MMKKKTQPPSLAEKKKPGINKKTLPAFFFFARTSLIKLKKMGAVDIFSEHFKKDGCSGHLFRRSISP